MTRKTRNTVRIFEISPLNMGMAIFEQPQQTALLLSCLNNHYNTTPHNHHSHPQNSNYRTQNTALLFVTLHRIHPSLPHAQLVHTLRHKLQILLPLPLLHRHVLTHPVQHRRKLRVEVVVLRNHHQRTPLHLIVVLHRRVPHLLKIALLILLHQSTPPP